MVTTENKLEIFENFIVDKNLKNNKKDEMLISSGSTSYIEGDSDIMMINSSDGFIRRENVLLIQYLEYEHMHKRSFKSWVRLKIAKTFFKDKKVEKIKYQSIEDFFKNVKSCIQELKMDESSVDFYIKSIEKARTNGQTALVEFLVDKKAGILSECSLVEKGIKLYISEEDVVNFYKKAGNSKLKLSWIKNYTRVIPDDVNEKKKSFDDQEAFDNYVILHFDPKGTSSSMTAKEKEKAKDPILFGVCKHSRKLFYVGDWIDEHCDLTLEKFLSVLEMEEARKLSLESIEKTETSY